MLKVRADLHLYAGRLLDTPAVRAKGLLVLVHQLPDSADLEVTAINFGSTPITESVVIRDATHNSKVTDVLDPKAPTSAIDAGGALRLSLGAYEGKALRIQGP
jgi:hypothetical protein